MSITSTPDEETPNSAEEYLANDSESIANSHVRDALTLTNDAEKDAEALNSFLSYGRASA